MGSSFCGVLQVNRYSEGVEGSRAMKKHAEMISSLQKGLASLESRLVDYQVNANSCAQCKLKLKRHCFLFSSGIHQLLEITICKLQLTPR